MSVQDTIFRQKLMSDGLIHETGYIVAQINTHPSQKVLCLTVTPSNKSVPPIFIMLWESPNKKPSNEASN